MSASLIFPALAAASAAAALALLPAAPKVSTTYGPAVAVGGGQARVYTIRRGDAPVEIGVALTEGALTKLPADAAPSGTTPVSQEHATMPDGHHAYAWILPMPEGNETPYRFVAFDWVPGGHMPPGVYDKPHFDFHFFTTSEAERAAIVPTDSAFERKSAGVPAADFLPAGYVRIPGAVPLMGAHWVDPTSPEHNGRPFTATFLYGTWDGRLIFAEPMITKAFIESRPNFRKTIPVPARHETPAWRPTAYRVYWDDASREHRIALAGLERRG